MIFTNNIYVSLSDIISDSIEMRILARKAERKFKAQQPSSNDMISLASKTVSERKSKAKQPMEDVNGNTTVPQKLCSICEKSAEISNPCEECLLVMNDDMCARQTKDPESVTKVLKVSNSLCPIKEISAADAADVRRSITQAHNQFVCALRDAESRQQFGNHHIYIPDREILYEKKANMDIPLVQRTNRMKRAVKVVGQQSAGHDDEALSAICSTAPNLSLVTNSIFTAGFHSLNDFPISSNEHKHMQQDGVDAGNSLTSMMAAVSAVSIVSQLLLQLCMHSLHRQTSTSTCSKM